MQPQPPSTTGRKTRHRAYLYMAIAGLTYLQGAIRPNMTEFDLWMLSIGFTLSVLITLRAFIDQTKAREDAEKADDSDEELAKLQRRIIAEDLLNTRSQEPKPQPKPTTPA